jgi:hypothetical protein
MPVVAPVQLKYSSLLKNFLGSVAAIRPSASLVQKDRLANLHFGLVACLHVCLSAWKATRMVTSLTPCQSAPPTVCLLDRKGVQTAALLPG